MKYYKMKITFAVLTLPLITIAQSHNLGSLFQFDAFDSKALNSNQFSQTASQPIQQFRPAPLPPQFRQAVQQFIPQHGQQFKPAQQFIPATRPAQQFIPAPTPVQQFRPAQQFISANNPFKGFTAAQLSAPPQRALVRPPQPVQFIAAPQNTQQLRPAPQPFQQFRPLPHPAQQIRTALQPFQIRPASQPTQQFSPAPIPVSQPVQQFKPSPQPSEQLASAPKPRQVVAPASQSTPRDTVQEKAQTQAIQTQTQFLAQYVVGDEFRTSQHSTVHPSSQPLRVFAKEPTFIPQEEQRSQSSSISADPLARLRSFAHGPASGSEQRQVTSLETRPVPRPVPITVSRPAPRPVVRPQSANKQKAQPKVAGFSRDYTHDSTGDNELSRFQLFQLRKKGGKQQNKEEQPKIQPHQSIQQQKTVPLDNFKNPVNNEVQGNRRKIAVRRKKFRDTRAI